MEEVSGEGLLQVQSFHDLIAARPQQVHVSQVDSMVQPLMLMAGFELEGQVYIQRNPSRLEDTIAASQMVVPQLLSQSSDDYLASLQESLLDDIMPLLEGFESSFPGLGDTSQVFQTLASYFRTKDGMDAIYNGIRARDEEGATKLEGLFPDHPQPEAANEDLRQQTEGRNPIQDLSQLYDEAELFLPGFTALLRSVARDAGLTPQIAPLKGKDRAQEKISSQYFKQVRDGKKLPVPAAWLYDVVRGSLVVEEGDGNSFYLSTLLKAFNILLALQNDPARVQQVTHGQLEAIKILRGKNRFKTPADGYRDINMNICLFRNGYRHTTEVQFKLGALMPLSREQHIYYEAMRTHFRGGIRTAVKDRFVMLNDIRDFLEDPTNQDLSLVVNTMIHAADRSVMSQKAHLEHQMEVMEGLLDLLDEHRLKFRMRCALLRVRAERCGVLDPKIASLLGNIADMLQEQGHWDDARKICGALLGVVTTSQSPSDVIAKAHMRLADVMAQQGNLVHVNLEDSMTLRNFEDSESHYWSALGIVGTAQPLLRAEISAKLGASFSRRAITELQPESMEVRRQMIAQAWTLLQPACDEIETSCGKSSPQFAAAALQLGRVLWILYKDEQNSRAREQGIDMLRRALEVNEEAFGQSSHQVMEALYELANYDISESLSLAVRAVQIEIQIFGLANSRVHLRYFNIVFDLAGQGVETLEEVLGLETAVETCKEALSSLETDDFRGQMRGNCLLGLLQLMQSNREPCQEQKRVLRDEGIGRLEIALVLRQSVGHLYNDDISFLTSAQETLSA